MCCVCVVRCADVVVCVVCYVVMCVVCCVVLCCMVCVCVYNDMYVVVRVLRCL